MPAIVCVVRPSRVDFLLANSTFLKKISHSSHALRIDNIKGSFNGTDIMTEYAGIANRPENFDRLFEMHTAFAWAENLERLVEATNQIVGRDGRFQSTPAQRATILEAPERALAALSLARWAEIERRLAARVTTEQNTILRAARVENVNLRGNAIERAITGVANAHELGDMTFVLAPGEHLVVDIKTKLSDRASAPKAYNIDKMLAFLAQPGSVFAFLMLGVDISKGTVAARLIPALDATLLSATAVQQHWAGRASRGVTQLSGPFSRVLDSGYQPKVDPVQARTFLASLLDR